jgi:quercetin dioxygenase-like cupin family protein
MTVEVVPPGEVEADESTPGVVRKTVFETENAVVVQSHIEGGTTTGWHYHGDRHVYGYIVEGAGAVEYGPDGDETRECSAGEYFYIAPETIHRDITPPDTDTVVLVCFVGSGPVVVNVDGPHAD